jgi:ABC-type antimicrobial peptide transport system permease subunit
MIPSVRQMLRAVDPDLPILGIAPFGDLMEKSVGLWIVRLGAILFGVFGGIALLLAVVGVYGVKAYAVACRTREIGIRMALGARRADVFGLIMRQGAMQTGLAVLFGLLLALAYYNRGYAHVNLGNSSRALADWKKAVQLQPSFGAELNPKIAQLEGGRPGRSR